MVNCGDILLVTLLFCAVLTWGGTCQVFEIFSDEKVRISFCHFGYLYPSHLNLFQIFPCFLLVFMSTVFDCMSLYHNSLKRFTPLHCRLYNAVYCISSKQSSFSSFPCTINGLMLFLLKINFHDSIYFI